MQIIAIVTPSKIPDACGETPVESRYAAMFDRYSGRRCKSAAFFVCVKPSVAAIR